MLLLAKLTFKCLQSNQATMVKGAVRREAAEAHGVLLYAAPEMGEAYVS